MSKYVVEIGAPVIDMSFRWEHYPKLGEKIMSSFIKAAPGGFTANAVSVLGALGTKSYCFCDIGRDEYTDLIINDFKNFGVSTDYIVVTDKVNTVVIQLILVGSEQLIVFPDHVRSRDGRYYTKQQLEKVKNAEYIYTAFSLLTLPNNASEMLKVIKENSIKVMFDADTSTFESLDEVKHLINLASIISINEFSAQKLTGKKGDEAETIIKRDMIGNSDLIVLLTKGKNGSVIVTRDQRIVIDPIKVDATDTTGAGDTFNAAFLHYKVKGKSLKACGEFAAAAAAKAVTIKGARAGAVSEGEVLNFMKGINRDKV